MLSTATDGYAKAVHGLQRKPAQYGIGRTKNVGVWWKWKIDPHTVDAVLVYAERGHGRRASLYTDYTFAVWDNTPDHPHRQLIPFAKAYSSLTDAEIHEVDAIVRKTTTEKFGPVRSVVPQLVFELGFEGIAQSKRHKSGVAVRFPRMLRWRKRIRWQCCKRCCRPSRKQRHDRTGATPESAATCGWLNGRWRGR